MPPSIDEVAHEPVSVSPACTNPTSPWLRLRVVKPWCYLGVLALGSRCFSYVRLDPGRHNSIHRQRISCTSLRTMSTTASHNMKYRFLGNSGLLVSRLSFGSWVTFDQQLDFEKAYSIMEHAYKQGSNFFDNAEVYENGRPELVTGKVVKAGIERGAWSREDLVISTKLFFGTKPGPNQGGNSRKHIVEGMKASLKRFDLDYVDLVFCHRADPFTPMEETVCSNNLARDCSDAVCTDLVGVWCRSVR
ncbi:hypothetical protein PF003_g30910 [Phytophthora fragariae]|nr:hypothetical protein PF003_g30910 [Phytophthora fragariae]